MANRLAHETSPYLLQHADNPVDWYPWGDEALQRAQAEDKPIFLSIGYSACHWCHVMAHESFEDPEVAAILREHFISIKVDREERPDLDHIYMTAVQAMTGSGGWPLSAFLTPDGVPFYGGTYYPPVPRHGLPSFRQVLLAVADAWRTRRADLLASGQRLVEAIRQQAEAGASPRDDALEPAVIDAAFRGIQRSYDEVYGGWGSAPKFPQPMTIEFLLRYHHATANAQALRMATHTLEQMARGGMYDQIGGGFHRYAVDERWLTPHFEKMLYDNAQLARVYLHAWQVTGEPLFRAVAEETLDYVAREMTDLAGGFYSAQDADSEGEEGRFFLWTPAEIAAVLGPADAAAFQAAYGVTARGNFEGKNILTYVGKLDARAGFAEARRRLWAAREERVHPSRDDKVLVAWNGLMLAAFAEAARILGRREYLEIAERNADFLLRELRDEQGRLLHTWRRGIARGNAYLDDYTHFIEGLLELLATTHDARWYAAAHELADQMIAHFAAPVGFYDTSDDHESLIVRPRELQDNAVPSGNAMAAYILQRLADLALEPRYLDLARAALAQVQSLLGRYPLGFAQWLIALDRALARPRLIVVVGDASAADTRALLAVCHQGYQPHRTVLLSAGESASSIIPALAGHRPIDGRAAAYVCRDFVCLPPVTTPEGLREILS